MDNLRLIKVEERDAQNVLINSTMHPITGLLLFIYLLYMNVIFLVVTKPVPSAGHKIYQLQVRVGKDTLCPEFLPMSC